MWNIQIIIIWNVRENQLMIIRVALVVAVAPCKRWGLTSLRSLIVLVKVKYQQKCCAENVNVHSVLIQ